MKKILTLLSIVLLSYVGIAQVKVGLPLSAPTTSALLDLSNLEGIPRGLLLPTVTTVQRNLILSPAAGLEIYNSDINLMQYWNGTEWVTQKDGSSRSSEATIDGVTIEQFGVYQVGTATSAANYITVTVNVTTPGTWSAQTSKKNGVSFSGGGVFSIIGSQTVKLYALTNVVPTINGITLYSMVMGQHDEKFTINYNSHNICLTPSPAIVTNSLCVIKAQAENVFSITGGTVNSNAITYSIYPTTGINSPKGDIIFGKTPAIIFSIPGKYTITYKSTNTDYKDNCKENSISASQSFSVVSGPLVATPDVYCNTGRFGPSSFNTGRTFTSLVDGVSVITTWSGTVNNSTYLYPNCGFAAAPSPNFNVTPGAGNTFSFSHPVGNLQLITGFDNADKMTITAKNGATDVTDQLVISKLTPACATNNYNQTGCNSFTALGSPTTTLGLNIGGAYFTSITITVNNNDCQFDLSFCNSKSIACIPPSPIIVTSISSPVILPIPVVAGNTITFTATGGLPKTSNVSWTLTSIPDGMLSGPLTGIGTTALATLAGNATGNIKAVFTVTNAGSGGCFPTTISGNQTFKVVSGTPAISTIFCSSFIGTAELPYTSSTTTKTIGNNTVTISRTGNNSNSTWSQNINTCGTPLSSNANFNGTPGIYTFSFDKDVSNLQIISGMDVKNDKHTYTIYKNGIDISSQLILTKLGACPDNSTIANNTITLNNTGTSNIAVSLGGVYFDRLDVSYSGPGGDSQFQLGICQGSSVDACATPAPFEITNVRFPSIFPTPVKAGNTVTFTATGGTPNTTGATWEISSVPVGLLSGETTGTGNVATAILTANAAGSVTVKFTANNKSGNCNITPVTKSQSVFITSGVPAANTIFCSSFIGTNELVSNTSTTEQTIGINKVIISRLGTNVNSTFLQTYASCGTPMNSNACFQGSTGINTFTFNNDVSNIQVLSGMTRVNDKMTFTIYKNGIDISNQLIVTKMGACDRNINSPLNNTIQLNVSTLNNVAVNLGGIYFDRLDIAYSSSGNSSPSNPFQLGVCNGSSLLTCKSPTNIVITNTTSPAVLPYPVAAGNTVNFTASGGLPNTGISWVVSSVPAGLLSGETEGVGNIAKANLTAKASGDITATYTFNNSGLGDCNPTSITVTKSVYITPFCNDFIDYGDLDGEPNLNAVTTQKIGENMVTITRGGQQDDWRFSQNKITCGTPMVSDRSFEASDQGNPTFTFNKSVTNIQVLTSMGSIGNTMSFKIYKNGADVTSSLTLTKLGKCDDLTTFPTNNSVRVIKTNNSNTAIVLGGIYFEKLEIIYQGDINNIGGGKTAYQLGLCTGASKEIEPCYNTKPGEVFVTSFNNPATLPNVIQTGNIITFIATGGKPRVGDFTYTLTSIPATGILTGDVTGTGTNATARLLAKAKGTVTATFTATNSGGACTKSTTTAFKTVNVSVDCPSPNPIEIATLTYPSTLPYIIQENNVIEFVATGGTPNNGDLQWTLTTEPAGLISSSLSGTGNSASGFLVANATGKIIVNFTSTYANSGDCVPITVSATKSLTLSAFCSNFIGTNKFDITTGSAIIMFGNNPLYITRSGNPDNEIWKSSNNGCGIPFTNDQCFKGSPGSAYTFNFSENVKDIQLLTGMDKAGDKLTIKVYKRGINITNQLEVNQLSTCSNNATLTSGENERYVTLNIDNQNNVAVNLGGVFFDRVDILYSGPGGDAQFLLGLCQTSILPNCTVPTGLVITNTTTPATLPYFIEAGNSINFDAGGVFPSLGITTSSWQLNSVPEGLISSALSGTGTAVKAILNKNATGAVSITYTIKSAYGGCEPTSATFSKTVNLSSVCTDFIGSNLFANATTPSSTTQTIGTKNVIITRLGYINNTQYSQNNATCGTPMVRQTSFEANYWNSSDFKFSKPVTNIQLLVALNSRENLMDITIFRNGKDSTSKLVLTNMGSCKQNFSIPRNNRIMAESDNNGNVVVNIGGIYFDSLKLNYRDEIVYGGGRTAFQLGICKGLAIEPDEIPIPIPLPCTSPSPSSLIVTSYTTPAILPNVIKGGTTITFNATGGTPNQGPVTWTLVTTNTNENPSTITTNGTGYTCTATFVEGFSGKAVASFLATNTKNGCSATTTTGTQTVPIAAADNGSDKIRARLTVSTKAYDVAATNTWVQVTPDEYLDIYQYIDGSSRYGSYSNVQPTVTCNEACFSETYINNLTEYIETSTGTYEYQTTIPKDIYVYGFSFRTAFKNTRETLEANIFSISRNAFRDNEYPIANKRTYLPPTALLNNTRYCYILKNTNEKFLKDARLGITIDVPNVISKTVIVAEPLTTNYAYFWWRPNWPGNMPSYPPIEHSHNVQIIGTPTKQW